MISGNGYRLRSFEPTNQAEIERMNLMYFHPAVMEAKGYAATDPQYGLKVDLQKLDPEMFTTTAHISRRVNDVAFAIADSKNRLIGWIWFYTDKCHPLPIRVAKKLGLSPNNSRVYQMSYEKLMSDGWPDEIMAKLTHVKKEHLSIPRKGVVVEGLRLAISRLQREYRKLYTRKRKLVLYGFVHPGNIASAKVLEMNKFDKCERMYRYDGVLHNLWVRIIK